MSDQKHQNQIQLRKAKLERMRKEREVVRIEKERRSAITQQEKEKLNNERRTREKATKLNDSDIDQIILSIDTQSIGSRENNIISKPSDAGSLSINSYLLSSSNKRLNLSICNLQITEIPPKETLTYSKQTQTDISGGREYEVFKDDDYGNEEDDDKVGDLKIFCNFSSTLPPGILSPGLPNVKYVAPALTPLDDWNPWIDYEEKKKTKLTEEETQKILLSENFQQSLIRAGRIMEKAVAENKNIFVDYTGAGDNDIVHSKALLALNRIFYVDHYSENRCITCMDWSKQFPELLLASYYKNEELPQQPDGIVMVWNTMFNKETPEFIYNCHSAVMSSCFSKFNPYLILGGTYSGQVVLWDNRVRKPIPIQYTKLNSKAHTQPIHCLQMVGTESSHNIISISSDGKLCSWSLDMMSQPLDVMQLQLDVTEKQKKSIAITCMDFPENGHNSLVLGGEDGCAYSAFRYGYKSGVNDRFENHDGPVTGISSHYNQSSPDFGHLFLTSSIDCTIKLWSLQDSKPLYCFKDNSDYIMDVAWSPVHPALFASVDCSGRLDLWNLNQDTEAPVASEMVKGKSALNRVSWKPNGKHITVGDDNGNLYVYNVVEHLAYPSTDEWFRFNETLNSIKVNYDMECYE